MTNTFVSDVEHAAAVGKQLVAVHNNGGIFGFKETPQHEAPKRAETLEQRLRFVTFSVAIDYLRDSYRLYNTCRATFDDEETNWVFDPVAINSARFDKLTLALCKHGVAQRPTKDIDVWSTVGKRLLDLFEGQVTNMLDSVSRNGPALLVLVKESGFLGLSGPKIGPLWLRMMNDCCTPIGDISYVPIPVDRHVVTASFATGALSGVYRDQSLDVLTDPIQSVWREAGQLGGFAAIHLDVPLWELGRLGCSKNEPCPKYEECPVQILCRRQIHVESDNNTAGRVRRTNSRRGDAPKVVNRSRTEDSLPDLRSLCEVWRPRIQT